MASRKPRILHITKPGQLRALRTPLRQEILQAMSLLGSASVKELASALGRAPASLYYHVHELENVGLIRAKAERRSGTRTETVYETTADQIRIDRTKRTKAFVDALEDLHRATLAQTTREVTSALSAKSGGRASDDSLMLVRLSARLSRQDVKKAQRMLKELAAFIGEHDGPESEETFSFTAAIVQLF